jgi:hypothetical protein
MYAWLVTSALTWQSMLWLSFTFLTVLCTPMALVLSHTYAVAQGNNIYRVLKHMQVCMTIIDPYLCCNPRPLEAAEFAKCWLNFLKKRHTDKAFQMHCKA